MLKFVKGLIKRTSIYPAYLWFRLEWKPLHDWKKLGRPVPPSLVVKHRIVKNYAQAFSIDTLIETGTFTGGMIDATRNTFASIFSIELDQTLYEQASARFAGDPHISIIHGDSGDKLSEVLRHLSKPALFWLDAHYSMGITARGSLETPILSELNSIFDHHIGAHVILIDDARCFIGQNDYPTLHQLKEFCLVRRGDWTFEVRHDVIRVHKPQPPSKGRTLPSLFNSPWDAL